MSECRCRPSAQFGSLPVKHEKSCPMSAREPSTAPRPALKPLSDDVCKCGHNYAWHFEDAGLEPCRISECDCTDFHTQEEPRPAKPIGYLSESEIKEWLNHPLPRPAGVAGEPSAEMRDLVEEVSTVNERAEAELLSRIASLEQRLAESNAKANENLHLAMHFQKAEVETRERLAESESRAERLSVELEAARANTKRLDWLDDAENFNSVGPAHNRVGVSQGWGYWPKGREYISKRFADLREAIDAARTSIREESSGS